MKYNKEFYEEILVLHNSGMYAKDIALKVSCSRKTILRFLKKEGINYKSTYKPKFNICKNCGKSTKNEKFCSRSCSAYYNNTINFSKKQFEDLNRRKSLNIKYKDFKGAERIKKIADDKLMLEDFNSISVERKKRWILIEQNYCCNRCGLKEWMSKPLILELEHKDGNHYNNFRENLECLCPNCHSLTNTWRGKNRKDKLTHKSVTIEDFKNAYLENKNVRNALIALDLVAKGKNYERMYKALDSYDIPYIKQSKRR